MRFHLLFPSRIAGWAMLLDYKILNDNLTLDVGLVRVVFCSLSLPRTLRQVTARSEDKTVPDVEVSASLVKLFTALLGNDLSKREVLNLLPTSVQSRYAQTQTDSPGEVMLDALGFRIHRGPSSLPSAGTGVFVTHGSVTKGATVAMYPGIEVTHSV